MESRKQSAIGRCATKKKKKKKKKKILLRNARTARNDADPVITLLMTEMCFYSPKINDNELPLVAASTDSVRVCVCLCQSVCDCVCSAAVSLCVCVCRSARFSLSLSAVFPFKRSAYVAHPISSNERGRHQIPFKPGYKKKMFIRHL